LRSQESEDEEATYRRELEAEAKGKAFSEGVEGNKGKKGANKGVKRPAEAEADEEKELAKIMMSKKHKQLYNKIMHGKAQKQAEVCQFVGVSFFFSKSGFQCFLSPVRYDGCLFGSSPLLETDIQLFLMQVAKLEEKRKSIDAQKKSGKGKKK
jgi:hypothetical protein